MKIDQIIRELQEVQKQHGDSVDVVFEGQLGYYEIGVNNSAGDVNLIKRYKDLLGNIREEKFSVADEDLYNIGSLDSIQIVLVL